MDEWEEWRRNGLQLQLVSRWNLRRLGFQIVKAQEDIMTPALQSRLRKLSPYLKDYSDYIVSKYGKLQIVEVKAAVVLRSRNRPFGSWPIEFTQRQVQEFGVSPVPVRVLLWEYGLARSLLELRGRAFYALVDFGDFKLVEQLAETAKMRLRPPQKLGPRSLFPDILRQLLQRSNAAGVKDIRPGCIVRG